MDIDCTQATRLSRNSSSVRENICSFATESEVRSPISSASVAASAAATRTGRPPEASDGPICAVTRAAPRSSANTSRSCPTGPTSNSSVRRSTHDALSSAMRTRAGSWSVTNTATARPAPPPPFATRPGSRTPVVTSAPVASSASFAPAGAVRRRNMASRIRAKSSAARNGQNSQGFTPSAVRVTRSTAQATATISSEAPSSARGFFGGFMRILRDRARGSIGRTPWQSRSPRPGKAPQRASVAAYRSDDDR